MPKIVIPIVIPDDAPPVMFTSFAYRQLIEKTAVGYYDTLPGSEEGLIEGLLLDDSREGGFPGSIGLRGAGISR